MLRPRLKKRLVSEINVVPYIDVMLVLLIIFMVTAPLLQPGVQVDLPQARAQTLASAPKESLIVSLNAQGQIFLNAGSHSTQPLGGPELLSQLQDKFKKEPELKILVKGSKQVDYGRVMALMVLLQEAGASSVGLITQAQEPSAL